MIRALARTALFCSALIVLSCKTGPTPFAQALERAETARRQGDFDEERREFGKAKELASSEREISEALYRNAHTWLRQGNLRAGVEELEALAHKYPESPRAARAWLDAGKVHEELNEPERAATCYRQVIDKYADSGSANTAVRRWVSLSAEDARARIELLTALISENQAESLDAFLRYERARAQEEVSTRSAILGYEDVARRHPLPLGLYTDEALLRAAELRRAEGDFEGALSTLKLLDRHSEGAAIVGTYVRGTYIKALFLRAEILRKDLKRTDEAALTYRAFVEKYPDSRLVDDALMRRAQLAFTKSGSGCSETAELRRRRPDSRYEKCVALFCPSEPPVPKEREARCSALVSE